MYGIGGSGCEFIPIFPISSLYWLILNAHIPTNIVEYPIQLDKINKEEGTDFRFKRHRG